jgi:hypothetical protein
VTAYLQQLDISRFDPAAAPKKTEAFLQIARANQPPEIAELLDLLERISNPDAVTLGDLNAAAKGDLLTFLTERKNRRAISHRLKSCGYVSVGNPGVDSGLWKVNGERMMIYAKSSLPLDARRAAVGARVAQAETRLEQRVGQLRAARAAAEEARKRATTGRPGDTRR